MQLEFVGRANSRTCEWRDYALLRDNVQHFIEGGAPGVEYQALHGLELAVDAGQAVVDAGQLRAEVLRAWYALGKIHLEHAALSLRTRAILTGSSNAPVVRGTIQASRVGWDLPVDLAAAASVVEAARRFVVAVLDVTDNYVVGDAVAVHRLGAGPRFGRERRRREHTPSSAGHGLARLGTGRGGATSLPR